MNPVLRNVLAVLGAIIIGGLVNMAIVKYGPLLIPFPEGVDPNDMESIKANIDKFEAKHFITPFLAHALNALIGAFLAARFVVTNKLYFAMGVAAFVWIGGVAAAFMIPAPTWFIALDLIVAYFPMGWLGYKLAGKSFKVDRLR